MQKSFMTVLLGMAYKRSQQEIPKANSDDVTFLVQKSDSEKKRNLNGKYSYDTWKLNETRSNI
ncbi:hypothetical protein DPMN_112289 [Dreissena polymorpha]|uniref:Uncharacterized protein n=1 Tax=Dreissena polymorpha TaxID=45954 RepID=A0A9D4KGI7_DREPO|nr:hypothetical protein DPMN_112289 [Dreissena polymorpha]